MVAARAYDDLTVPEAGSGTARAVLSAALARLPRDLTDVLRRPCADGAVRADVAALSRTFAGLRERAGALAAVLRRANLAVLLRCARDDDAPSRVAAVVATLGLELAALGALAEPLVLRRPPARVVSLGARRAIAVPDGATLTLVAGRAIVDGHAVELDTPDDHFPLVDGDIVLALADENPIAMVEAHPDKGGNPLDLGGRPVADWQASLRDALDRIARYLPEIRREMDLFVQQLVPVGYDPEAHLSASYREAIGTIYLTLHPQPMTMTEALVHEFQHGKLNALFEVDPILHNGAEPRFQSPVRPDLRPLHGVLLAAHAFVPVARLYEAMVAAADPLAAHPSFAARRRTIVEKNHEGIALLRAHADPTPAGKALLDELARWDARDAALLAAPRPAG